MAVGTKKVLAVEPGAMAVKVACSHLTVTLGTPHHPLHAKTHVKLLLCLLSDGEASYPGPASCLGVDRQESTARAWRPVCTESERVSERM